MTESDFIKAKLNRLEAEKIQKLIDAGQKHEELFAKNKIYNVILTWSDGEGSLKLDDQTSPFLIEHLPELVSAGVRSLEFLKNDLDIKFKEI